MEFLNRIELKGIVGNVYTNEVTGLKGARLSVMTEYAHRDASGMSVVDMTWHNIAVSAIPPDIKKGSKIHVTGRLNNRRWTDGDGIDRFFTEIIADKIEAIPDEQ